MEFTEEETLLQKVKVNLIASQNSKDFKLSVIRKGLLEQLEILLEFEQNPPFLRKFNNFIRKKAIKKISQMFKELKDTKNEEEFIEETSGYFSSREVYLETVKLVD